MMYKEEPLYTDLQIIELQQMCVQFNKNRDIDNFIGKFTRGRIELEKTGKLEYVGMYLKESR